MSLVIVLPGVKQSTVVDVVIQSKCLQTRASTPMYAAHVSSTIKMIYWMNVVPNGLNVLAVDGCI